MKTVKSIAFCLGYRYRSIEPISDPRNLVVLPKSYHASLHTTAYHNYVTERLRVVAGDRAGVEATLESLKAEILAKASAGIRWE